MNQAYADKPAGAIAKETITTVLAEFDGQLVRLSKLVDRLTATGDRLQGSRPSAVDEDKSSPPPSSLIDSLSRKRRYLSDIIQGCEDACQRIEDTIG